MGQPGISRLVESYLGGKSRRKKRSHKKKRTTRKRRGDRKKNVQHVKNAEAKNKTKYKHNYYDQKSFQIEETDLSPFMFNENGQL